MMTVRKLGRDVTVGDRMPQSKGSFLILAFAAAGSSSRWALNCWAERLELADDTVYVVRVAHPSVGLVAVT